MTPRERTVRFGRDKEGDLWVGPFLWRRVEREQNHGDCSTTTRLRLTLVRRWTLRIEFVRSWR